MGGNVCARNTATQRINVHKLGVVSLTMESAGLQLAMDNAPELEENEFLGQKNIFQQNVTFNFYFLLVNWFYDCTGTETRIERCLQDSFSENLSGEIYSSFKLLIFKNEF